MEPQVAAAVLLLKMAYEDGTFADEERLLIDEACRDLGVMDFDALIVEAQQRSIDDILQYIPTYADRFFVALRLYLMANIDQDFTESEQRLFSKVVDCFGITPKDCILIQQTERALHEVNPREPDPRLSQLYQASCFSKPKP